MDIHAHIHAYTHTSMCAVHTHTYKYVTYMHLAHTHTRTHATHYMRDSIPINDHMKVTCQPDRLDCQPMDSATNPNYLPTYPVATQRPSTYPSHQLTCNNLANCTFKVKALTYVCNIPTACTYHIYP